MTNMVLSQTIPTANGRRIGRLTLNHPEHLNALNTTMIGQIHQQLESWRHDSRVVAVVLDSNCDRAFCAGGDLFSMHHIMTANPNQLQPDLAEFLASEYRLDHAIFHFPKPLLVWADGIIMGGGVGLLVGASHRVVTERARLAMPEVMVGLFPDVGSTWFLNRMEPEVARFWALTGSQINGVDAVALSLADEQIKNDQKQAIMSQLQLLSWQADGSDHQSLSELLHEYRIHQPSQGWLTSRIELIEQLCAGDSVAQVQQQLNDYQGSDGWIKKAALNFASGSPISAHIIWRQLAIRGMSLADCFRLELSIVANLGRHGELTEGIRALLIDKDRTPNWRYASLSDVPDSVIDDLLTSPWPQSQHPLVDLRD
ncbi:enoyl-CoA hydratase/isomerase family protein [Neiella sp. HB171785]|uniref:3-hydroxyisobutyryl-CoA hydrolase n=1 Tax=Neiella litorisoli TaxID=2771431 RepID=A0A8J6UFR9_9GAMM|nr:enoyl-CoA hydratase/isomerase family protein [Neiella litorisoli]MBD1391244.1 enoyl-CoA hydratase/isomerase family protein [Neiella litorisoli]